jgi:hypothetical protein
MKLGHCGATRARLVALGCFVAVITMAASGTVISAAPAGATPVAGVHVIVNPPPQNSLLQLCLSSQTSRSGTCADLGAPSPPDLLEPQTVSIGTGQFSTRMFFGSDGCRWGPWTLTGPIAALTTPPGTPPGVVTDNTTLFGPLGTSTAACDVPPFALNSTDGRVTGTCYGTQTAIPGVGSMIGFELRCIISIDHSPVEGVEFQLAVLQEGGDNRAGIYDFSGVYVEYPATTGHPPI